MGVCVCRRLQICEVSTVMFLHIIPRFAVLSRFLFLLIEAPEVGAMNFVFYIASSWTA